MTSLKYQNGLPGKWIITSKWLKVNCFEIPQLDIIYFEPWYLCIGFDLKVQILTRSPKTYENSTTLIIFWNSSGGWGCNNFNNASNAHWQNSSASIALLNGLVQLSQCVLTKILPVKYFLKIKLPLFVECRLHIKKFHFGILSKQHLFKIQNFAVTVRNVYLIKIILRMIAAFNLKISALEDFSCFLKF